MKKSLSGKVLSFLLAASLLSLTFAGCSGGTSSGSAGNPAGTSGSASAQGDEASAQPASGEKVKFSVTFLKNEWHGDPNNMEVFQKMAEKANVEIDWQIYENATWPDKKNLILAGGDPPDVFYMNAVNNQDIAKYASQGMFIDLTELVDQYCPNLIKVFEKMPYYKNICINPDDGKMYTIGRGAERDVQYTQALHYINKKWLDQLGMDVPKTVDEHYAALKAFKENDMNGNGDATDEIPFTFHFSLESPKYDFTYSSLFGAFGYVDHAGATSGAVTAQHFITDDGELVYVANKPEYRDAIAYYSKFVQEGLWDAEGFTTQDSSVMNAKGNNAVPILGSFVAFDKSFIVSPDYIDDYVILEPLAGPNGERNWLHYGQSNGNVNGTQFVMTANAKGKDAAIMAWLNEHFDPVTSIELFLGPVGTTLKETGSGMLDYIPTPEGMNYSEFRYGNAPVHVPCAIKALDWGKTIQVMDEDINKLQIAKEHYRPYSQQSSLFLIPTQEETKWMQTRGKDIDDYVNKMQVKWMTEGGIENEWDTYVAELEKLGVEEYQAKIQQILDRMSKQ